MSLIERARKIRKSLPIEKLRENGINRPPDKYKIRVTYPPLALIDAKEPVEFLDKLSGAVYIHYPFCPDKCGYCHFDTYKYQSGFIELLMQNISMFNVEPTSIHIGGGTPAFMKTSTLDQFLDFLFIKLNPNSGIEVTLETRPSTLTKEKLAVLNKYPITRLNIGVQDFNERVLKAIQRKDTPKQAIAAIERVRDAGFDNINIDLIYGCPDQNLEDWKRNLEKVTELRTPSITTYHLDIKKGTGVERLFLNEPQRFPGEDNNLLMHIMSFELFKDAGYIQNPVDWFTLGEKYTYNHQNDKWGKGKDLIAFGPDVYWFVNGYVGQNLSLEQYTLYILQGKMPIMKAKKLHQLELDTRESAFKMKTKEGLPTKKFSNIINPYAKEQIAMGLIKAAELDLITLDKNSFRLTYLGQLYADEVFSLFFSHNIKIGIKTNKFNIYVY